MAKQGLFKDGTFELRSYIEGAVEGRSPREHSSTGTSIYKDPEMGVKGAQVRKRNISDRSIERQGVLQSVTGQVCWGQVRSHPTVAYMPTCLCSLHLIFSDITDLKITPRTASRSCGKWQKLLCWGEAALLHCKSSPSQVQGETTEWLWEAQFE